METAVGLSTEPLKGFPIGANLRVLDGTFLGLIEYDYFKFTQNL